MSQIPQTIPEGSVLRDDGCICPAEKKVEEEKKVEPPAKIGCPYDPRFPNQNQTKHCYVSFVDYQRCTRLLGKYPGCSIFYHCYTTLCPQAWIERWFEQMENGTFAKKIYPPKPIVRGLLSEGGKEWLDDDDDDDFEEPPC